jgi:hypothetical protein
MRGRLSALKRRLDELERIPPPAKPRRFVWIQASRRDDWSTGVGPYSASLGVPLRFAADPESGLTDERRAVLRPDDFKIVVRLQGDVEGYLREQAARAAGVSP